MSTVDPTSGASNTDITTAAQKTSTVGKDEFLKLLVTQLQNQDPLDPVKNQDFIAQLAQFNSLEQMINLNTNFEAMNTMQSLTQATAFIGKQVVYNGTDGNPTSGAVTAIQVQDGKPMLVVGSSLLSISDVLAVGNGS